MKMPGLNKIVSYQVEEKVPDRRWNQKNFTISCISVIRKRRVSKRVSDICLTNNTENQRTSEEENHWQWRIPQRNGILNIYIKS